jgi:tetratricopeptide (TPR) repeat protein
LEREAVAATNRIRTRQILREAEGYLELNMPLHALAVLERLGESSSSQSQALYLRGEALRLLARDAEAIECLSQASDLAPNSVPVWLSLGTCYKRSGRPDLAIEALEHARDLDPRAAQVHYQLACNHSLTGSKNRAIESLARALAIDSDIRKLIEKEPAFNGLRSDPDFQAITSIIV